MILSMFGGLILGAVAVIFALQNNFPVTLTFMGWEFTSSLAFVTVFSVLSGILITLLMSIPGAVSSSFERSRLRKENKKLASEIENRKEVSATPISEKKKIV